MARARRPVCDVTVQTTVTVRGKKVRLQRDWLSGLWSWAVFDHGKKIGWVLQQFEGRKWACVSVPETPEDVYNDIWYEYDSRADALWGLVPKETGA